MAQKNGEAWVSIDRQALEHNLSRLSAHLNGSKLMAVVKANAYGHGAQVISRFLEERGVSWFAVARVREAEDLRASGVRGRILLLEAVTSDLAESARDSNWTPLLSSLPQIRRWATATNSLQVPLAVHLKIDVGLGRLGLALHELTEAVVLVEEAPGLWLEAIASHFSRSEERDGAATANEELRFERAVQELPSDLRGRVKLHLANSCGALYWPSSRFDMVRCGGALYGLDLSAGRDPSAAGLLRPVMSVAAPISQLRRIEPGEQVGYGGRFRAERPTTVAVIPIGYADGYSSHLVDRAEVLIEQRRCPVIGAISMDRITVDVTDIENVDLESRAVLLGGEGELSITAGEIAGWGGDSLYEVTTRFGLRMRRQVKTS